MCWGLAAGLAEAALWVLPGAENSEHGQLAPASAKLAHEPILHSGDQESERLMISKFRSEKEADKLDDGFQSPGEI